MEKIVGLIRNAMMLKERERRGWKRAGIKHPESVAEHTFMLAFLAMLLGDKLGMNTEKMIKMALLHDMAEAIMGDITPHEMKRDEKLRRENDIMEEMLKNFDEYRKIWREFSEGKSEEAKMVREMDVMEMVLQAENYSKIYGGKNFLEFKNEGGKIKNPALISLMAQYFLEETR